jgi:hypothetical protein
MLMVGGGDWALEAGLEGNVVEDFGVSFVGRRKDGRMWMFLNYEIHEKGWKGLGARN